MTLELGKDDIYFFYRYGCQDSMPENVELTFLNRLSTMINDAKIGLDPEVLGRWFEAVISHARSISPDDIQRTMKLVQDPVLPMKFELKSSKRAVPFIVEAIERNLGMMPFATRLYFLKVEEILEGQYSKILKSSNNPKSGD